MRPYLWVVLATGVLVGAVAHARTMREPCPPGSYGSSLGAQDTPLASSSPSEAFVLGSDTVSIGACGATSLRLRVRRRYTTFSVTWPECPGFGAVRLHGNLQTPPASCVPFVGVIRWRDQTSGRRRAIKFEALRIDDRAS